MPGFARLSSANHVQYRPISMPLASSGDHRLDKAMSVLQIGGTGARHRYSEIVVDIEHWEIYPQYQREYFHKHCVAPHTPSSEDQAPKNRQNAAAEGCRACKEQPLTAHHRVV